MQYSVVNSLIAPENVMVNEGWVDAKGCEGGEDSRGRVG